MSEFPHVFASWRPVLFPWDVLKGTCDLKVKDVIGGPYDK
jgi:hypothetical protein